MKSNVLVAALTLAFGALACEGAHEPGPGGDLTDSLTFDGALRIYDAHISRRYERGMDIPLIIGPTAWGSSWCTPMRPRTGPRAAAVPPPTWMGWMTWGSCVP